MKNTANRNRPSADEIAEKAMSGEDISQFFTNKGDATIPGPTLFGSQGSELLKVSDEVSGLGVGPRQLFNIIIKIANKRLFSALKRPFSGSKWGF